MRHFLADDDLSPAEIVAQDTQRIRRELAQQ